MDEEIETFADMDILAPIIKTALWRLTIFQISECPAGSELVSSFTVAAERRGHHAQLVDDDKPDGFC